MRVLLLDAIGVSRSRRVFFRSMGDIPVPCYIILLCGTEITWNTNQSVKYDTMMTDWTNFECEGLLLLHPVGLISDGGTVRKVWLSYYKPTKQYNYIRSNEIKRKCRSLKHNAMTVHGYHNIKRVCAITGRITWLSKRDLFSPSKSNAQSVADKNVSRKIGKLQSDWKGFNFHATDAQCQS